MANRRVCAARCRSCAAICRCTSTGSRAATNGPPDAELYPLYSELEFKSLVAKAAGARPICRCWRAVRRLTRRLSQLRRVGSIRRSSLASPKSCARSRARRAWRSPCSATPSARAASPGTGVGFSAGALAHAAVRDATAGESSARTAAGAYDAKRGRTRPARGGVTGAHFADDAMIGAHLLDPSRGFADVEDAAAAHLHAGVPGEAAAHADAALQLIEKLRPLLEQREQLRLYESVEVPLAPVLAADGERRHRRRSRPNCTRSAATSTPPPCASRGASTTSPAKSSTSDLPQQLGKVLFEKLAIPGGKKTKTGWATGAEVLQVLAREYPICALVLEWREVTKLKNTYVDVIPQLIDPRDGRLHTVFNQTATATGRLSSTNPNLQNVPVRGDLGRRIRRAFVARDGYVLLAADYSQIELRLMAHLSGDEAMRTAFEEGQDIHDFTARQIFSVPGGTRVDAEQRRIAKSVNFGLFYGMSDFGLAQRLEIGRAEAKEITAAYFARFPSVRAFIDRTLEEGRRNGYVSTILGRRRYMPGLASGNYMLRAAAEREATNAPLQGSAADLVKLAMVNVDAAVRASGLDATLLLQIHDELIFEVAAPQQDDVANLVRNHMESAMELSVPLEVTLKSGRNWYDVEQIPR